MKWWPSRPFLLLAALLPNCMPSLDSSESRQSSAVFGVIYGGQIQQRQQIQFETDRSKQTLGFRLTLPKTGTKSHVVEWQLNMPGNTRRVPDHRGRIGLGRLIRLGTAKTHPQESTFEQVIELESNDPLGTWNLRVLINGQIVLDRPFLLVSPPRQ